MSDVQTVLRRAFNAKSLCGLHIDLQRKYYKPHLKGVFDAVSRTAQSLRKFDVPNIWVAATSMDRQYPPRTFEEFQDIAKDLEKEIICEGDAKDVVLTKDMADLFISLKLILNGNDSVTRSHKMRQQRKCPDRLDTNCENDTVPNDTREALLIGNPFHYLTRERKFDTFIMDGINAYACFPETLHSLYENAEKYKKPVDVVIVPEGINIPDWYHQEWVMEKKPELIDGDLTKTYMAYLNRYKNADFPITPHVLSVNEIDEILSPY